MLFFLILLFVICLLFALLLYKASKIPLPKFEKTDIFDKQLEHSENFTKYNTAFVQKNAFGFYELYAEGKTFDRAYAEGQVLKKLKEEHEDNFISSINELIPNPKYLLVLKWVVGILNRNLYKYFNDEYLLELYALSFSSSTKYNYIAPAYQRVLNYHAAHDIGHALQNMGLVACSSFVTNNINSEDEQLLMARNLDFSPSEKFNLLKVLYFIKPENGYKYISYSWPGFIGVVSGMNEHGLCVVIHAAKSRLRFSIGTPVSIVAREILQYASSLEDARKILSKKQTFVSELFLVCSATDNSAIIFEKEPNSLSEYKIENNSLICVNHLQSNERKNEVDNINWQNQISSAYRYKRLKELLEENNKINPISAAKILRDVKGLKNENIGLQNENAINQLAAHHGIIFKPQSKEFWVSTTDFVLGKFIAYNFNDAFNKAAELKPCSLHNESKNISEGELLNTQEYEQFMKYSQQKTKIKQAIKNHSAIPEIELNEFKNLNPFLFTTHELLGDYYFMQKDYNTSKAHYNTSLNLNIPTLFDKTRIEKKWKKL